MTTDHDVDLDGITTEDTVTIHGGRWAAVPLALVADDTLTDRAVRVWTLLAARWANRAGQAWPSRSTIADALGCSTDTIDRAIRQLEQAGWLTVIRSRRPDRTAAPNRYHLHTEPVAARMQTSTRTDAAPVAARMPTSTRTDAAGTNPNRTNSKEPDGATDVTPTAHEIVTGFYDHIAATTGHPPLWSFPGTVQIVKRAQRANWPTANIKRALLLLHRRGRTITAATLDEALQHHDTRQHAHTVSRGPTNGTADARPAHWNTDALRAMFDTNESTGP